MLLRLTEAVLLIGVGWIIGGLHREGMDNVRRHR